jgi:MFS superfamily sulfate permease-like transporter
VSLCSAEHILPACGSPGTSTLFRLFPLPVLGVILFFAGIELATSTAADETTRADRTVLVVTAGIALWNMGLAYLAGLVLYHAIRLRIVRV